MSSFLVSGYTIAVNPMTARMNIMIPTTSLITFPVVLTKNLTVLSFSTIKTSSGVSFFS